MHLNTRSTIVLLLLAFSVGAFGCVDSTEESDNLATIPQEIVLFSAKPDINSPALSFGYSKVDGWQLLRYAELQDATIFDDDALQTRQQEMNFSGRTAKSGRFSGSLADTKPTKGAQYSASFSGKTQAYHNFYGNIAGGPGGTCNVYFLCDFVELICDAFATGFGAADLSDCRETVSDCREAISSGMAQLNPKEQSQFCSMFDISLGGSFDFDDDDDDNNFNFSGFN